MEAEIERRVQARTQAMRQSEAHFRLITDYATDMISRHGPDGTYRYASPSCLRLLGYQPEEMIGKSALGGMHPDDEPLARTIGEALRETGSAGPVECRKRRRDGSYLWAEVTIRGIRDADTGELAEFIAVTRDISQRHKAEENLRLIESAVQQADEAVLITEAQLDRPGPRIEYANPAFERMTGYTTTEVIGRTPRILQGPRTSRAVLDQLRTQLSQGKPFEGETFNYRKDGSEYILRWHIGPVRDAQGRITHWVSIQRDVTEQKRAEQLARQRQAELAHVGRLSTMGEMASELAHELNQPLAAIVNYAHGAMNRADAATLEADALKAVLERIATQADRASQIIRRLRRFVRKREPQRTSVNVNDLVRDVIDLVEPELRQHSVQVDLALAEHLPLMPVDTVQIEQVLLNLVRNALEAMEPLPTAERRLRIVSEALSGDAVQVDVIDEGPGIPDHQLEHIFEPFFTTKQRGMGMGLPISQSIAEAHGGRLEALHAPAGGMDFRLTLALDGESLA